MFKSPTIARLWGIPVKLHISMLILIPVVLKIDDPTARWIFLAWLPVGYFCILLHEFGHALVAQAKGGTTRTIYLTPLGGLALISGLKDDPHDELQVAVAGPLVTLGIALIAGLLTILFYLLNLMWPYYTALTIAVINMIWFVFNLIPAYPMDGGRVLKSFLAPRIGKLEATKRTSDIGHYIGMAMIVVGVAFIISDKGWQLFLIGCFVAFTSRMEYRAMLARKQFAQNFGFGNPDDPLEPTQPDFVVGPAPYASAEPEPVSTATRTFWRALLETPSVLVQAAKRPIR